MYVCKKLLSQLAEKAESSSARSFRPYLCKERIVHSDTLHIVSRASQRAINKANSQSRIGLVAEGGCSHSFVQRMGIAKATEVLLFGEKCMDDQLLACGFLK